MSRAASVEAARRAVFDALPKPRADEIELTRATGRVLREDVTASEDLWPFARAAMDGIAVRFDDIGSATPQKPVALPIVGAAYCGDEDLFDLPRGCAARIATGAALPRGADTVIRQEIVRESEGAAIVERATRFGEHVFPAGEDARAGEVVLQRGTLLNGGHVAMLASLASSGFRSMPCRQLRSLQPAMSSSRSACPKASGAFAIRTPMRSCRR